MVVLMQQLSMWDFSIDQLAKVNPVKYRCYSHYTVVSLFVFE